MGNFCPLLKEQCKGSECAFWLEKCSIFDFLQKFSIRPVYDLFKKEEKENEKKSIPSEIINSSADELAEEIFSYAQKELQDEEERWLDSEFFDGFWNSKGIEDKFELPKDIQSKIKKAEKMTQKKLEKDSNDREQRKYQQEKAALPQLIEDCINWAKQNGLKRVTKSDISAFLLEKNLEIFTDTETILYSKANARLKE